MSTMSDRDVIAWARDWADQLAGARQFTREARYRRLADLAEKGAEPSARDPFTDPRQGDMFIDPEGDIVEVASTPSFVPRVRRTDKRVTTPGPQTVEQFARWIRAAGCRAMTSEEARRFERDGTRPTDLPAPPGGGR